MREDGTTNARRDRRTTLTCLVREVLHVLHQPLPEGTALANHHPHVQVLHGPRDDLGRAGGLLIYQHGQPRGRVEHGLRPAAVNGLGKSAPPGGDNV